MGCVADAVGVFGLIVRERHAVFVVDCVFEAVDGGVDAQGEHVLVEGGHDARSDVGAPGDCLAVFIIEGDGGEDARGAHFELHVGSLVKDIREDVLVVGDGADNLEDELAVAHDGCGAGSVVGMFVLEAVVLLVHADYILHEDGVAFGVDAVAVEVFDVAQAVAA